ncbi:hypothetical protein JCM5353_001772 [Sporobolomyces roseus]
MSAPPHEGWPQEGSVWEHWSDLLLATQLAALREGYSSVSKAWHDREPHLLKFRCFVGKTEDRKHSCHRMLLHAVAEDAVKLDGKWVVQSLRLENLAVERHKCHTTGVGLSQGFKTQPKKKPKLSDGQIVEDWNAMHLVEAALRSSSRLKGAYLHTYSQKLNLGISDNQTYSYFSNCVLGERCKFYVRFRPKGQVEGEGWICEQICLEHSCTSIASTISGELAKRLSFWPKLKVIGEYKDATGRRIYKKEQGPISKTDQHLGDYPVLAPGQTSPRRALPLPKLKLVKAPELEQVASTAKAQIPPSKDRQTLQTLKTRRHLAQTMDDLTEIRSLKSQIEEMEKGELEENETKEAETESNKRQRTIDLLESLEGRATVKKKSKSNLPSKPSSNLRLPPPPLNLNTPIPSTTTSATQFDELKQRQDSLVKALDLLFTTRRLILDLEHKLAIASALDDIEETKKLEGGMGELEKRKEEIEKKVTRRKNKVRRTKLRIKYKYEQMLDKTVTSKSDSAALKKQQKGKTAGKEKKNKGK